MYSKALLLFGLVFLLATTTVAAYVSTYSYGYTGGAPAGYGGYGGTSSYGVYDGNYGLVPHTSYPYAGYQYAENRLAYGHYSRFTGNYHSAYTGRVMPETWRGYGYSNAIPPRAYPYTWQTIHRG